MQPAGLWFGVIGVIVPLFLSVEIILAFFFILFGVFILSIAANIFHFFVLAMIGLALMTYFGVIFVPMILFSATRHLFDNWWRITVSFVLQPVVMTTFIAFPLLLLDNIMGYDNTLCELTPTEKSRKIKNCEDGNTNCTTVTRSATTWTISGIVKDGCKDSLGYKMTSVFDANFLQNKSKIFFDIVIPKTTSATLLDMLSALLKTLFFCYLFLMLAEKGGDIASQITSGPQIGAYAIGAAKVFNAFMNKIMKKPGKGKGKGGGDNNTGIDVKEPNK